MVVLALTWLAVFSGCVSTRSPQNWTPQNGAVSGSYHECLLQAQQPSSSAFVGGSRYGVYGRADASAKTNKELLCSCMGSKGYALRRATTTEVVVGLSLSPVWVPFSLLGTAEEYWCPG